MNDKNGLKERILKKSTELFRKNGYTETSNKQIAQALGCTTAALYYHFEKGKAHILREVIQSTLDNPNSLRKEVRDCRDLNEFMTKFSQIVVREFPRVTESIMWLFLEFPNLPKEEKAILQEHVLGIHHVLQTEMNRFMEDKEHAARIAWMMMCSYCGFHLFFKKMGIGSIVGIDFQEFVTTTTKIFDMDKD